MSKTRRRKILSGYFGFSVLRAAGRIGHLPQPCRGIPLTRSVFPVREVIRSILPRSRVISDAYPKNPASSFRHTVFATDVPARQPFAISDTAAFASQSSPDSGSDFVSMLTCGFTRGAGATLLYVYLGTGAGPGGTVPSGTERGGTGLGAGLSGTILGCTAWGGTVPSGTERGGTGLGGAGLTGTTLGGAGLTVTTRGGIGLAETIR